MAVSLSPHVQSLIADLVASGRYPEADGLVEEAIRLIDERDRRRDWLQAELAKGLEQRDRGQVREYTKELLDRLSNEAEENMRRGKQIKDAIRPQDTPY